MHGGRTWRAIFIVGLLALVACASESDEPQAENSDAPSKSPKSDGSAVSESPSRDEQFPVLTTPRFETPSENILCESSASSLVCVIGTGLAPEPSSDFCGVDWIGLLIKVGRFAGPACSGDPGDLARLGNDAGV